LTINIIHILILQLVFELLIFKAGFRKKMVGVPPPGVGGMVRVSYSEMGCQPFQKRCQTYQEYVNLSSITSDNTIRKRAKKCQPKSGKDSGPSTVNRQFHLQSD